MAIAIDETTFIETLLSHALFAGAMFQLVCIFAVMFVPENEAEQQVKSKKDNLNNSTGSDRQNSSTPRVQESVSRKGKREKKKHR